MNEDDDYDIWEDDLDAEASVSTSPEPPPPEPDAGWARDALIHQLGEDPFDLVQLLQEVGEKRARAKTRYEDLDRRTRQVRAQAEEAIRRKHPDLTNREIKSRAYDAQRVQTHFADLRKAEHEYERLDSQYWTIKAKLDLLMSTIGWAKSEMYASQAA